METNPSPRGLGRAPSDRTTTPRSLQDLKSQARRLREASTQLGHRFTHSQALEVIAAVHGAKDWNTLVARSAADSGDIYRATERRGEPGKAMPPWQVGANLTGEYLGHPFRATLVGLSLLSTDHFRVALQLDESVDVAASDAFSAERRRIRGVVNREGVTHEKISGGVPQLVLYGGAS